MSVCDEVNGIECNDRTWMATGLAGSYTLSTQGSYTLKYLGLLYSEYSGFLRSEYSEFLDAAYLILS